MTRFWGTVQAVRGRLTLAKFESETHPSCDGHYLVITGTRTIGSAAPEPGTFTVAIGRATQEEKKFAMGDLVRGDAEPVPETNRDAFADLYRVRTVHIVARAKDRGAIPPLAPPRTDPSLTPDQVNLASRRVLAPENLNDPALCQPCPYGTTVGVVRLSDPRDLKRGVWSRVPACLGPVDCPYYRKP